MTTDDTSFAFPSVRSSSAAERPDKVAHEGPRGVSTRVYLAAKSLPAACEWLLANGGLDPDGDVAIPEAVTIAYQFADELIKQGNQQ